MITGNAGLRLSDPLGYVRCPKCRKIEVPIAGSTRGKLVKLFCWECGEAVGVYLLETEWTDGNAVLNRRSGLITNSARTIRG